MNYIIRHGDVIIQKIDDVKLRMKPTKKLTLAEGEVTGHFHELKGELMFADDGEDKYFEVVGQSAELTHQEHDTLQIPKGKYKYLIQREVDLLGEVRQVMD